jgi:hypothetical protein
MRTNEGRRSGCAQAPSQLGEDTSGEVPISAADLTISAAHLVLKSAAIAPYRPPKLLLMVGSTHALSDTQFKAPRVVEGTAVTA